MEKLSATITLNDASRVFRIVYVPQEPSQARGTKERSAHENKSPPGVRALVLSWGHFAPQRILTMETFRTSHYGCVCFWGLRINTPQGTAAPKTGSVPSKMLRAPGPGHPVSRVSIPWCFRERPEKELCVCPVSPGTGPGPGRALAHPSIGRIG